MSRVQLEHLATVVESLLVLALPDPRDGPVSIQWCRLLYQQSGREGMFGPLVILAIEELVAPLLDEGSAKNQKEKKKIALP